MDDPITRKKTCFADLADLDEDKRIEVIGRVVSEHAKTVAVIVDDECGKAERYIAKIKAKFPGMIRVITRAAGPIAGTEQVIFGPAFGEYYSNS